MPKIRTYSNQAPVPVGTGAALATNIEGLTNTGEAQVWGAVGGLADIVGQLAQKKMSFDDSMAQVQTSKNLKTAELNYLAKKEKDGNSDNYYKYLEEYHKEVESLNSTVKWGSPQGKTRAMADLNAQSEIFSQMENVNILKQKGADTEMAAGATFQLDVANDKGDIASALQIQSSLENYKKILNERHSPELAEVLLNKAHLTGKEQNLQNQVGALKQAFVAGDTTALDKAVEIVQSAPLMDEEKRQSMLANIESYKLQIEAKKRKNDYDYDVITSKEFLDKTTPKNIDDMLSFDDILRAYPKDTDVDVRKEWEKIQNGALKPEELSTVTNYDGQKIVLNVLSKISRGEYGTRQAYKDIANARYVDKTINEQTFQWAKARIEKPYQPALASHIESTLNAVSKSVKGTSAWYNPLAWGETTPEAIQSQKINQTILSNVSNNLLNWVDTQIESGKIPTAKEVYVMATQLQESENSSTSINAKPINKVIMTSPDGKKFSVPIEKKQLFLDNGYK